MNVVDLIARTLAEAIDGYDLQARFDELNAFYFDGRLPEIPVRWGRLTKVGGVCTFKVRSPPNGKTPRMRRLTGDDRTIVPDSIEIVISDVFAKSGEALDGILIHEMIHAWFAVVEPDFDESHGRKFERMRRELAAASGVDVPLTDSTRGLSLSDPTRLRRVVVALMSKTDGTYSVAVIDDKFAKANLEEIKGYFGNMSSFAGLFSIETEAWTTWAARFTVQRRTRGFSFYKMDDVDAVGELEEDGERL